MTRYTPALSLVLVCALAGVSAADLTILDYQAQRNDRFYVGSDKAFIGQGFDFSGVGKAGNQWAVLISPTFALSARHAAPGGTVTFISGNDPNGPSFTDTVVANAQIGSSDLNLVQLATPVPSAANINFFPIVADNEAALLHQQILVYGQPNRVGTNNIDTFDNFTVPNANAGRGFTYDYDATGASGPNEAMLDGFDSGGPSLVSVNGRLALVGIHWFTFQETDQNGNIISQGSGDTYVSPLIDQINATIASLGSSERVTVVSAVPEPAALVLVALGLPAVTVVARRRRPAA
jgi:hypothetical protein